MRRRRMSIKVSLFFALMLTVPCFQTEARSADSCSDCKCTEAPWPPKCNNCCLKFTGKIISIDQNKIVLQGDEKKVECQLTTDTAKQGELAIGKRATVVCRNSTYTDKAAFSTYKALSVKAVTQ